MTTAILSASRDKLNAAQLALELGVSSQFIYHLAIAGLIPHFRVAGALCFERDLIAEWRQRNTLGSLEAALYLKHEDEEFFDGSARI